MSLLFKPEKLERLFYFTREMVVIWRLIMVSINARNNFPNYVSNISFYEVLNTNEVFSLDVDEPVRPAHLKEHFTFVGL